MKLELFLARRVPRENLDINSLHPGRVIDVLEMHYNYGIAKSPYMPNFKAKVKRLEEINVAWKGDNSQLPTGQACRLVPKNK